MSNYYVVVHKDDDSDFGAFFPDLPGCFSAGETEDEALANARISLRMYVEDLTEDGHALPPARTLADLRADEDVKAALKDGHGFLASVPLIFADKKRRVNVTLEPSLISAIDAEAKVAGTSRSEFLATAARHEMETRSGAVSVRVMRPSNAAAAARNKKKQAARKSKRQERQQRGQSAKNREPASA